MRVSKLICVMLLAAASPALAAKWSMVSEGVSRAVYLDAEPTLRDGGLVRIWTREVYTEEQRSKDTGALYYSINTLMSFECVKRTSNPVLRVFYGGDGTEIRRVNVDTAELPAQVVPGSLQESLLERACAPVSKKKPKVAEGPVKLALADGKQKSDASAADAIDKPEDEHKAHEKKPAESAKSADAEKKQPAYEEEKAATDKKSVADKKSSAAVAEKKPVVVERKLVVGEKKGQNANPVEKPRLSDAYRAPPVRLVHAVPHAGAQRPVVRSGAHAQHETHWNYEGAASWGKLKPEFAACSEGKRQSPIDIKEGARLELEAIKFDYRGSPLRIIDNGHTIQANLASGSSITVGGQRYELKQFHFHKPSEERIDGVSYDMVAHLVHKSSDNRLAVVAVLFSGGDANPFLKSLWPYLPLEAGREFVQPEVRLDLNTLLPEDRGYFAYMGSLTTPPCSEGVLWLVMKTPVPIASDQVEVFGKLYSMNARPLQPANGRLIKESM